MPNGEIQQNVLLRIAAAAVIASVGTILLFPLFIGTAPQNDQTQTSAAQNSSADSASPSTPVSEGPPPGTGPLERDLLSWAAPLLHPGTDTTSFENITPNVREMRLGIVVEWEIQRLTDGINAFDPMLSMGDLVQKRIDLLAHMASFVTPVQTDPAAALWKTIIARPPVDFGRVDASKHSFQDAIDRLKEVQDSGFQKLDDPRLDARKELRLADETLVWVQDQINALRARQRDLDRAEFTVWTHAPELPAEVIIPTPSGLRQVAANLDFNDHLEMIKTVRGKLAKVREDSMQFLRAFPAQDNLVKNFLQEPEYRNDPVAAQWAKVALVSATFLKEFHTREGAIDGAERAILFDKHYTPSIVLGPVVEANKWAEMALPVAPERDYSVKTALMAVTDAPIYSNDMREPGPNERRGEFDRSRVANAAARRKLFARHGYAITFDRRANRYNWALADILEPYVSYDYWWQWATDADWYRGSDVRLDPLKFPKDAEATRNLWREFCSIVDGEGRLNAQCVKALLKTDADMFTPNGNAMVDRKVIVAYWENLFLPDNLVKKVEYRRPPLPSAQVVALIDQLPGRSTSARLKLDWGNPPYSGPYVMSRNWGVEPEKEFPFLP